jgi:hypothetical protein
MGHTICFEAGRFTSIQSSWTASRCSRKWMSGPATAWAQSTTGQQKQIAMRLHVQLVGRFRNLPSSAGRSVFFLDKPLSWMSGQ